MCASGLKRARLCFHFGVPGVARRNAEPRLPPRFVRHSLAPCSAPSPSVFSVLPMARPPPRRRAYEVEITRPFVPR